MTTLTPRSLAAVVCGVSLYLAGCACCAKTTGTNPSPRQERNKGEPGQPSDSAGVTPRPDPRAEGVAPTTSFATTPSRPSTRATTGPSLPFEADIRAFEAADAQSPPPPGSVVFVGSSSIRLWKTLASDFGDVPASVLNRGFGGSQVADSIHYADRIVLPYRPSAVVLYAGDNDLASGKSPQQVAADVRAFASKVHAQRPDTPVLFLAIKPSIARRHLLEQVREANGLVKEFADEEHLVEYVDVFTPMLTPEGEPRGDLLVADKLHLNAEGYKLWTEILRPHLDRALARR